MALRLSIVSRQGPQLGAVRVKEFGPEGGTIGRSLECDWPLPDTKRYLSSRHASIDFRSGSYYIVDTSMNGVYVNDAEQPVGRGKPQRLFSGDRLRFGEYEIAVEIDEISSLIDENHVDPVDLAQRVEAPEPTGKDLVDAYEITGVGIEMLLSDDELETLSPPPRAKAGYFEIVDDDAAKTRTPSGAIGSRGDGSAAPGASTPSKLPAASKPAAAPGPAPAAKRAATGSAASPPASAHKAAAAPKAAAATSTAAPKIAARNTAAPNSPAPNTAAAPKAAAAQAAAPKAAAAQAAAPKTAAAQGAAPNAAATHAAAPQAGAARATAAQAAAAKAAAAKAAAAAKPATQSTAATATAAPTPAAAPKPVAAQKPIAAPQARAPAAPSAAAALGLERAAGPTQAAPTPIHASRAPDLEPFFRGARISNGVQPQQVDAFLFRLGQVMRAMIVGITQNLHLRADQKNALRLPSTTIQPQDNNPLKLSAGVEEAFVNLLLRESSAHLAPVDAVREAFDDVQLHQQLMLKAIRSALDAFVARLDPDELEHKFARGRQNVLMNAANRLKYWDLFKDLYDVVAHHPPGELPLQFLEDFSEAYGRELEQARNGNAADAAAERQAAG